MHVPDQLVIATAAGMLDSMARRDLVSFARSLAAIEGEDFAKDVVIAIALLAACDASDLAGIEMAASIAAEL